ncbi:winged helix-turn-helix domain-containing protein [Vibrio ishigakensis]|uniref:winged helix-turn-helix domain-containing protein n=1 Tax=Vibrio ishigakensis TaxID=1481914 RepID=UPI0021C376A7|nr:winged helix-turn-helix domain-containing protein [Vibrio ishigakensis]
MKIRYNIDDKFVFVPQDNTLIKVENKSQHLSLGTNETRLLEYFVEHRNTTISRHELVSALWNNRDVYVNESSLRQSVSTLRKALGDSTKLPKFIKTVPKVGYEFIAIANPISFVSNEHSLFSKNEPNFTDNSVVKGTLTPPYLMHHKQLIRIEAFVLLLVLTLLAELLYWFSQ